MRFAARRLIGCQHLDHHLTGAGCAGGIGGDHHPVGNRPYARGDQSPLPLNLDHAGAAIPVGAIARVGLVAQMRDRQATALRGLPNGPAFGDGGFGTVEGEGDLRDLVSVRHHSSSAKCFIVRRIGFGAAWPSPQMLASPMAWHSSSSSG